MKDLQHLNGKGADNFSHFFNDLINKNLLQQDDKQLFIDHEIKRIIK